MSSDFIYAGRSLLSPHDKLTKAPIDYIYHSLIHPKAEIVTRIRNLRIIRNIDRKKYSALKRMLPYLVCGTFNPPFRNNDNFAYTEHFILDIDNLSQKSLTIEELKERLSHDKRVELAFASPSNDGLKVLFSLSEKCYDSGIFSLFYKVFARAFSGQYNLEQLVDPCTSDVSRACFMSVDEQAYYNPEPEKVRVGAFIDLSDPFGLFEAKHHEDAIDKKEKKVVKEQRVEENGPDDDALEHIKEILKLKNTRKKEKSIYVPQQLDEISDDLKKYIENTGVILNEIDNINYGKKLKMQVGHMFAEINLFYGKKGFTVVISPRNGTDDSLNQICADLVNSFFTSSGINS